MANNSKQQERARGYWLSMAISLLIAVGAVVYIWRSDLLKEVDLSNPRWDMLGVLFGMRLLYFLLIGVSLALYLDLDDVHLTPVEWFGLSVGGAFTNLITPYAGAAIYRGGYLKLRYEYSISRFASLLAANVIINYFISGIVGSIVLIALLIQAGQSVQWQILALMAVILVAPIVTVVFPLDWLPIPAESRIMRAIKQMLDGWKAIRTAGGLLVKQSLISLAITLLQAGSFTVGLLAVRQPAQFVHLLLASALTNIARVTPVRDLFGLSEFVAGVSTQLTGATVAEGVTASLLVRLGNWAVVFVLGPFFTVLLSRRLGTNWFRFGANTGVEDDDPD